MVAFLASLVFVVHDVPYALSHPFWADEGWVAVSTRAPLDQVGAVTSASPTGWTFLLRALPWGGEQRYRLLPLLFAATAVVLAYLLGRRVSPNQHLGGILAAGAALLAPAMLVRNDLKQYTADAFVSLLLLWLTARVEAEWSTGRLAALLSAGVTCLLISHTTALVLAAALVSLAFVRICRREWARLRQLATSAASAAAAMILTYWVLDRPHQLPQLTAYWRGSFPPDGAGLAGTWRFVVTRWDGVQPFLGTGGTVVTLLLLAAGLATLVRNGFTAVAVTYPVLLVVLLGAATQHVYPLFDPRTSTFWLVPAAVLAAVGASGVALFLARRVCWQAGLAVVAVAAGLYVYHAWPYVRSHRIPTEDVRAAVRYLSVTKDPADVVFVNNIDGYGYAYYSSEKGLRFNPADYAGFALDFRVSYPDSAGVVVAVGNSTDDLRRDWRHALELAARRGAARIWVLRGHVGGLERLAFPEVVGSLQFKAPLPNINLQVACVRASCLRGLAAPADLAPPVG